MTIIIVSNRLEKKRREAVRSRTIVDRHRYFKGVAETRFVKRKVFRLIEEPAKLAGLDPLEHQGLIPIYGSPSNRLRVKEAAKRLDIVMAFASELVKSLKRGGYVTRARSEDDQRIIFTAIRTREAVMAIVMFHVGISPNTANT